MVSIADRRPLFSFRPILLYIILFSIALPHYLLDAFRLLVTVDNWCQSVGFIPKCGALCVQNSETFLRDVVV